jgi:hypothetical protein
LTLVFWTYFSLPEALKCHPETYYIQESLKNHIQLPPGACSNSRINEKTTLTNIGRSGGDFGLPTS